MCTSPCYRYYSTPTCTKTLSPFQSNHGTPTGVKNTAPTFTPHRSGTHTHTRRPNCAPPNPPATVTTPPPRTCVVQQCSPAPIPLFPKWSTSYFSCCPFCNPPAICPNGFLEQCCGTVCGPSSTLVDRATGVATFENPQIDRSTNCKNLCAFRSCLFQNCPTIRCTTHIVVDFPFFFAVPFWRRRNHCQIARPVPLVCPV